MKNRAIFLLGLILMFSSFVIAQTKTVTNADLEKFRQKRLAAEKNLRENYAEMGFPSPEELKKQNEESQREFSEFSSRLREQQIARQNSQGNGVVYYYANPQNGRNHSYTRNGFINYNRYYGGYYNRYRHRPYRNSGNRRFKPSRDFRKRFIRGLPDYVLRNHRFTQINPRINNRPVRRRQK